MVIAVSTESGPDGLTVVKTAKSDAERVKLATEAELLRTAAHPGVVEVVDHTPDQLRLRHAGTTLTHLLPLPADQAAAVVCALAEVVASIHDAGVVHRSIDADHVVLDRSGRPRLCGFGNGAMLEDAGPDAIADDAAALGALFDRLLDEAAHVPWTPANSGARHRTRRKHAREVFRTVAGMAQRRDPRQRIVPHQMANAIRDALPGLALPSPPEPVVDDEGVPVPGVADLSADAGPLDEISWSDRDLEFLATSDDDAWSDDAPAEPPTVPARAEPVTRSEPVAPPEVTERPQPARPQPPRSRPETTTPRAETASGDRPRVTDDGGNDGSGDGARARLERALAQGPPPITIRESEIPAERRRRRPPPEEPAPRSKVALAGVALFVAGVIIAPLLAWALGVFDGDDGDGDPVDAAETDDTTAPSDGPAAPTTWPAECELPALTGPDLDEDGCPEPVTVNGRNVMVGDRPIAFGEDGDLIAVGDTDCDGVATPYLLRPSTGQVFVWPQWPLEAEVQVRSTDQIPGATGIERRDGTCDVIVVTGSGETVVAGTP